MKSLYDFLIKTDIGFPHKFLWKIKTPAKMKMFFRLLARRSILTKDNLNQRGWKGDKTCVFCGKQENIDHLYFSCSAARLMWSLDKCSFDLKNTPQSLNNCLNVWIKTFENIETTYDRGNIWCVLVHLEMQK